MFAQSQTLYVSVAHRYWNFQWSEAKNREVYGRQASSEGVGSNLRLDLGVRTEDAAEVSFSAAVSEMKKLADHQCFFVDVPRFVQAPSTMETLSLYLAENLFRQPPSAGRWDFLTVAETENLSCTVRPNEPLVDIRVRVLNLELTLRRALDPESGLAFGRAEVWDSVRAVAPEFAEPDSKGERAWGERLWRALEIKVKGLHELRVDLGSQRFLRVQS